MAAAEELAALAHGQQATEAEALEAAAVAEAAAGVDTGLSAVLAAALAAWVAAFGSLTAAPSGVGLATLLNRVRRDVARATRGLGPRAARSASRALPEAAALGAGHAAEFARAAGHEPARAPSARPPADAVRAASDLADTINHQLGASDRLLTPRVVQQTSWRGVVAGLGAARRALSLARAGIAWSVHRAINAGAAQTIAAMRANAVWVAEPDACVRCLAYAGRLADSDRVFPGGLSADPQQERPGAAPVPGPPLHAHCRCKLLPWRDEWAPPGGVTLPDLLRDRALLAVAAGSARPSESRAARLRAARDLLTRRDVPARVRRQARAAVAAGRF